MSDDGSWTPSDTEGTQDDVFAQEYGDSATEGVYETVYEVELRQELETLEGHNRVLKQLTMRVKRLQNNIELRKGWAEDAKAKLVLLRQLVQAEKTGDAGAACGHDQSH
jgi:transposase-like protein